MSEEKTVQDFCSDDDVIPSDADTGYVPVVPPEPEPTEETAQAPQPEPAVNIPVPPRSKLRFDDGPHLVPPPPRRRHLRPAEEAVTQAEKTDTPPDMPPPPPPLPPFDPSVIDGMREESKTAFEELKAQNEALKEQLSAMTESINRLTAQLANTNRAVTMHETIEGNLNKELQSYKNDFYGKLATPFLLQLISLYSEMSKEIDDLNKEIAESAEPTGHEDVVDSLKYYLDKIHGSLVNSGVEMETPEAGEKIDPLRQSIVRTVPSDDPEMNGIIESVRSNTYTYNNKVLLRAKVAVYKAK